MRGGGARNDVRFLFGSEAEADAVGAGRQEGQHDKAKGNGQDALDEQDPAPGQPAMSAVKVLLDTVGNEAIEGTRERGRGEEDGAARGDLVVLVEEGEVYSSWRRYQYDD